MKSDTFFDFSYEKEENYSNIIVGFQERELVRFFFFFLIIFAQINNRLRGRYMFILTNNRA